MNSKNILALTVVLLVAGFALWTLIANKGSSVPKTAETTLNSDLQSLNSTDLNKADSELQKLDSESSTF